MKILTESAHIKMSEVTAVGTSLPEAKQNILDAFSAWVLIAGGFLLPLFFFAFELPLEYSKTILLSGLALLALSLWLLARLREGTFSIPKSALLLAGFIVTLLFAIASLFSPNFSVSFSGLLYELGTTVSIVFLFILMALGAILLQSERRMFFFYGALALSFTLVFLFHISRFFLGADFLSFGIFNTNVGSPVGKWNDVAVFSGLVAIMSLLALEVAPLGQRFKFFSRLLLAFSLVMLVVVNFFLVWIIIGALALIVFVYHLSLSQFTGKERRLSIAALAVLVISALFLVAGDSLGQTISQWANVSHVEVRPSWGATTSLIGETWKESPLFGSGPNRFTNQWLLHKPAGINESIFWNTDFTASIGLIPTFAVTTGILGLIGWIVLAALFLYKGLRAFFVPREEMRRFFLISSFAAALYLWIVAVFYVPNITLLGLTALLFGAFIAALVREGESENFTFSVVRDPRVGFVSVLVLIVLLIGTVLGGFTVFQNYRSVADLNEGGIAFNREGDVAKARAAVGRAIAANPKGLFYRRLVDVEIARLNEILTRQGASIETIRAEFQDALGSAIAAGQAAVQYDETNYQNWISLGRVYATVVPLNIAGAHENAKTSFERARELNPRSPAISLRQARLELSRGNVTDARTYIDETLALKSNYSDAILLLAQLEINEGNVQAAISSLERATLIDPNNVGLFFQLGVLNYSASNFGRAATALERAVALTPNYANAKYFLGLSYYNLGRTNEAIQHFEDIEATNPDNAEVKRVLENLRAGEDPLEGIAPPAPTERGEAPIEE